MSYCNVDICIIRLIVLLTTSWFFIKNLDNNSSLRFQNASSVERNIILEEKKASLIRKISRIYFHLEVIPVYIKELRIKVF